MAATGSTDGSVKLINLITGKVSMTIDCGCIESGASDAAAGDETRSVEAVAFSTSLQLLVTATVGGVIEVWEASNWRRRCFILHEHGVSGIRWNLTDMVRLHYMGLDGCLNTWDARSGQLLERRVCHHDQILAFDVAHSADADLAVTASEDTTCRVFQLNKR